MVVTCWHIWQARNDARNNEAVLHPSRVVSKVLAYVEMIVSYLFKETKLRDAQALATPRWSPPPTGVIYVNVMLRSSQQSKGWVGVLFCGITMVVSFFVSVKVCWGSRSWPKPLLLAVL
jgi:hypothetical protein